MDDKYTGTTEKLALPKAGHDMPISEYWQLWEHALHYKACSSLEKVPSLGETNSEKFQNYLLTAHVGLF